ncbi:MAG: hypothetical protein ABIG20_03160 [archaeon]
MVVPIIELLAGGEGTVGLIRTLVLLLVVLISILSLYFSRLQGAKLKLIDIREQVPLSAAHHTIIFTNYGNKTGVVIGPKVIAGEDAECEDINADKDVLAIEPHSTLVRNVEVHSEVEKNFDYHIEYTTHKGKILKLPKSTYLGSSKGLGDAGSSQ